MFAEAKAAADGRGLIVESNLRTLVKAGKLGAIEALLPGNIGGGFQQAFQKQNRAREAYRLLRNWVFSATNVTAKRVAGQQWMAGHYEDKPEEKPGKRYDKALIPDSIKRPRTRIKSSDQPGEIEHDKNHPVLWLLDKPNKVQGRFEFVYITVMNLLLTGEWYWIGGVVEGKKGKPKKIEVWAVPSSWITPDHSNGLFSGYKLNTGYGEGVTIPAENVARGYFPDPADIKGCMAPLASCVSSARIDDFILASQEASFERGINPNLIITIGKSIGPDGKPSTSRPTLRGAQRRQIVRAIRHIWSQTVNQGDPAILDGLIDDVKKLQMTPQEMDWQNSGNVVKARIFQAFGVNSIVVGEITPSNKAQATVAETSFCAQVVNPIVGNISSAAAEFFGSFYEDGDSLAVWLENAEPKDEDREDKQWSEARKNGDVLQEEVRARLRLEPLPDKPPERSPLLNNPQTLTAVANMCGLVGAGTITHDAAVQILMTTLQISEEDAGKMVPDDPTPEQIAARQPQQVGSQNQNGNGKPAAAGKPPAKDFDPNEPRDESGRWTDGGGGKLGESPVSDHAAAVLDQWTTPATGSRTGDYEAIRKRGEAWVKGAKDKGFQDLYDETQYRLKSEGIKEINSFRGLDLPADHPLAKAIVDGTISVGHAFEAKGMSLNSWSEDSKVATRFADSTSMRAERESGKRDTIGIVLRRVVPAKEIVTGARVHAGFLAGESEIVATNTESSRVEIIGIYRKA